jgi:AcrR family transcriptional regulator
MTTSKVPGVGVEATRQRILDATIEVIQTDGEAAVRVVEVAHRAGVSQGMVTYYFGTRTNLVAEAQHERFLTALLDDIGFAVEAVDHVATVDELRALADQMTSMVLAPERDDRRRERLNSLGYAAGNPETWKTLRAALTASYDKWEDFFRKIADRGWLQPGLAPRAAATMISAYSFGLVVSQLDDRRPTTDELATVIGRFVRSLIVD